MKISIMKSDLARAVTAAGKAVVAKTTRPILECLLIDASTDEVYITGYCDEMSIKTKTDARVYEHGLIAVPFKLFHEMAKKMPNDEVVIFADETYHMHIASGKVKFDIAGKDAVDFPKLPIIEEKNTFFVSENDLKSLVSGVAFAASSNENDKMSGINLVLHEGYLKANALDGFRIAQNSLRLSSGELDMNLIVKSKSLTEAIKLMGGEDDKQVRISFDKNHISFEFEETMVMSRLMEGEYFNVDRMIKVDVPTMITTDRSGLGESLERALLLIKEDDKKNPLIMQNEGMLLKLSLKSKIGALEEAVMANNNGESVRLGINPRYLLDIIKVIDNDEIAFGLSKPKAPVLISGEGYKYIVLPVNIPA